MALIIAGERSGVGKTTVTLALLAALCRSEAAQGFPLADGDHGVQSFKVGPDYIDPMFHRYVTGRPCRNLDPILTSETYVRQCFATHSQTASCTLVEGVMGLFDGASGQEEIGSTAHIARILNIPVLLVLDCRRLSRSVGAIALGYQSFDPRVQIVGVVLNQVGSDRHEQMLRQALDPLDLDVVGVIRRDQVVTLPDRHLGLIPTDELLELNRIVEQLAQLGRTCFDWEILHPLLQSSGRLENQEKANSTEGSPSPSNTNSSNTNLFTRHSPSPGSRPRIAIARDRAFSFYYADNLDLLQELGAELVEWSPMQDSHLPSDISGLYFGGGFPEVFAADLADNPSARRQVHRAIAAGIPTYAECGGLMYLCETLIDFENHPWPMVGTLPFTVRMGQRLALGYRRAIAQHDTPLMKQGETVWGHEFHRSVLSAVPGSEHQNAAVFPNSSQLESIDSKERALDNQVVSDLSLEQPLGQRPAQYRDVCNPDRLYRLRGFDPGSTEFNEGWRWRNLHASYVHLHWGNCPDLPARFIHHCKIWTNRLPKGASAVEN